MQFVIIGKDATDAQALERRMAARAGHIAHIDATLANMVLGVATLNSEGVMNGSVLVVDFPSRVELDAWLQADPYVTTAVWQDVEIIPCKIAPSFLPKPAA